LLLLSASLLTGCLALAAGSADGGSDADYADDVLKRQIWHLAGWVSPSGKDPQGHDLRSVIAAEPDGTDPLTLTLTFQDSLDSWPIALEAQCRLRPGDPLVTLIDAKPFGGENLIGNGGDHGVLGLCLAAISSRLTAGPWLEPLDFKDIEPGLSLAVTKARFGPRLGDRQILIIKASSKYFRLAPYHESEKPSWKNFPVSAQGWFDRLPGASLIINAGQYYPDRSHMGLLKRHGTWLAEKPHQFWKGYLVQDRLDDGGAPIDSDNPAGIKSTVNQDIPIGLVSPEDQQLADSGRQSQSALPSDWALIDGDTLPLGTAGPEHYDTVIQSYMILDRLGRIRVRRSDRLASRTALAIDPNGDLLIVLTIGALSLSDLAALFEHLGVVSALGLDGGFESQVAMASPQRPIVWQGQHTSNILGNFYSADYFRPLPAIIALERLTGRSDF
jgi:hypothetical protein